MNNVGAPSGANLEYTKLFDFRRQLDSHHA